MRGQAINVTLHKASHQQLVQVRVALPVQTLESLMLHVETTMLSHTQQR